MKHARPRRDPLNPWSADNWLELAAGLAGLVVSAILFFDLSVSKPAHLAIGALAGVLLLIVLVRDTRRRWRRWRDELEQ